MKCNFIKRKIEQKYMNPHRGKMMWWPCLPPAVC